MNYNEAKTIFEQHLLEQICGNYKLNDYIIIQIPPHDGGRNLVYTCTNKGINDKIIRIAFENDRTTVDYLAELEFVRYLHDNGASIANVVDTVNGELMSILNWENHSFFIVVFDKAKGQIFRERNYQYIDDKPIEEYFYNCGKTLGKIHQLSKTYQPTHKRYSFFDKYTKNYINKIVPQNHMKLREKLNEIVNKLHELEQNPNQFGLVHFDFNDGNYMIDFDNGNITVFDFDNCCYCPFMFDLAALWQNGVGWTIWEKDVEKRQAFMEHYFANVLEGYRSETSITRNELQQLPFFINVNLLEMILSRMEDGDKTEDDEELHYFCKCIEDNIPFSGFFSEIYSHYQPFCLNQ